MKQKHSIFYILKMDISKYFYSIDHEVLLGLIEKYVNEKEYKIIKNILKSTDEDYIHETIGKLGYDLPNYKKGKGLPIGNLTSQFLAIYYLNELDHKIVHAYQIKRYVRYMDDFLLIHDDKEYLKEVLKKLESELEKKYCLKLNKKKIGIYSSIEGVVFLGIHYRIKNNKLIMTLPQVRKKRIRDITKVWKN